MRKSIKVVSIFLWVCMIILGLSACGESAGNDEADLIDIPIAKESGYVSTAFPNATVSLEDETEVKGDLPGHDHALSTEDNIVEHEKAGYCDNTVTKISRESRMGGESWEVSFDGSYGYSDPTGVNEGGFATVVDFSETEYIEDKITYATGTYKGWDTFVAEHQPVTEEEYLDAVYLQEQKQNAEWYEFTDENIGTLF